MYVENDYNKATLRFTWLKTKQHSNVVTVSGRSNKEVLRHLRAIVNHRKVHSRWSKMTPFVLRIFNATVDDSFAFVACLSFAMCKSLLFNRSIFMKSRVVVDDSFAEKANEVIDDSFCLWKWNGWTIKFCRLLLSSNKSSSL